MEAPQLIEAAVAQTGLDDFGGDELFEGLEVLTKSIDAEAQLSELGSMAVPAQITGALANRLRIIGYRKEHPDVADERIESPLIVVGMFRAGTTFLSKLLDQDPANRALLSWETADSVPPPTPQSFRSGPRVEAVAAGQAMLSQLNPAMDAVHKEQAHEATECLSILGQDFKSLLWESVTNVPTYGAWLDGVDHRSAYEHHKRVLQVLQHGGVRGRWTLKSPHHATALETLAEVYPDATLVVLHRDPVVLCASVCSLIRTLSSTFTDADHTAYIARRWPDVLELCIDRLAAFRDAHPSFPIVDVQYRDLVTDPVATVDRIEAATGTPLSDEAAERMTAYVDANPKGKFGTHHYDLADFGLRTDEVRERFTGYVDRYEVPLEQL